MGTTGWSDSHYHDRARIRKRTGKTAFGYHDEIRQGRQAEKVHPKMDPKEFKNGLREARDSDAHPNSTPIAVLFDVTGSMGDVPRIMQASLCTLMNLCLRKGYVDDPAILIGGIGDAKCDRVPVQIGQFESGNEIENDLNNLYLEGGGGGQKTESYELGLYFLARKVSLDCYEKHGKKGYAFLIGDEMPYPKVSRREVRRVFGDTLQADIPLRQILDEAQKKFEIFSILPNLTSYYHDMEVNECWKAMFGQNALRLEDPTAISELIASTIGLSENSIGLEDIRSNLEGEGITKKVVKAVASAFRD